MSLISKLVRFKIISNILNHFQEISARRLFPTLFVLCDIHSKIKISPKNDLLTPKHYHLFTYILKENRVFIRGINITDG